MSTVPRSFSQMDRDEHIRIFKANRGLVRFVINDPKNKKRIIDKLLNYCPHMDVDDFMAIGESVLWQYIPGWKPEKAKLSTYLYYKIYYHTLNYCASHSSLMAMSPHIMSAKESTLRANAAGSPQRARTAEMQIRARNVRFYTLYTASDNIDGDSGDVVYSDPEAPAERDNPFEMSIKIDRERAAVILRTIRSKLDRRERLVVRGVYWKNLTYPMISQKYKLGITKERVRQILVKALRKLRSELKGIMNV